MRVRGIVQGVGFRPFVYNLARQCGLVGWVLNDAQGVWIEAEGEAAAVEDFLVRLRRQAPAAAAIDEIAAAELPLSGDASFTIRPSGGSSARTALVSPDIATCADCQREICDPRNRRYGYAFTNCTNCGPRYTITIDVPYDRARTTMEPFAMCPGCLAEYEDPADRRFHAQPNACPVCGPAYRLLDSAGREAAQGNSLAEARRRVLGGSILAVKGIGGYHLVCDARNEAATALLRLRKHREDKPLAVMCGSLDGVRKLCRVSRREEALLGGAVRPIVLLAKGTGCDLAPSVAPGSPYLGVMLPYAPVHWALLGPDDVWVMTSGNASEAPILFDDAEALARLSGIADGFLVHNRRIHCRVDDSVARVYGGAPYLLRRGRGLAPAPVFLKKEGPSVLAAGGERKNTFCLTKGKAAFVGAHIGDLENAATMASYQAAIAHDTRLFAVEPEVAAFDLHPEYLSTKYVKALPLPRIGVQHHHAHIASVLAEHGLDEPVIGVAFDGMGYGDDGTLWGGEFLLADLRGYTRLGHCRYLPLPGGAKAIEEPWRQAAWLLRRWYGDDFVNRGFALTPRLPRGWALAMQAAAKGINAPLSSSAGRLFDTAAAILGIRTHNRYEGQAAVELELAAAGEAGVALPYEILEADSLALDLCPALAALAEGQSRGDSVGTLAASFHVTAALATADMIRRIGKRTGIRKAALSGGVFQNVTLLWRLVSLLEQDFSVYLNRRVPPNDGGLSLGQAAVARERSG